jgi:hypothetical protein
MTIDASAALTFVDEILGDDPAFTKAQVVNMAGQTLVNMHPWSFLDRPGDNTTLSTTADQSYIALPSDLEEIDQVVPDQTNKAFRLVTKTDFALYQRGDMSRPSGYVGTLSEGVDSDGALEKRLYLYPTPSTTGEKFWLHYSAGWNQISASPASGRVLTLPQFLEPLFWSVLQAVAKGVEEDDDGAVERRLESVRASSMLADAKRKDADQQPYLSVFPSGGGLRDEFPNPTINTGIL